jgi:formylglycine-generating enzyme required for sulfatase activity
MPLSAGHVLNKRYRIVTLLGQGGFGAVYKAWDLNLSTHCAVKENLDTSSVAQRQFEREARMLYNLRHANLTKVSDYFVMPGQGQYLVMDFIEGQDLQEMLDRSGALPQDQVLTWIDQVCDALVYLHSRQPPVIHRDIKPANIKITPQGEAVLVDFGIAKVYDPNLSTTAGARAVTPGYSPPEQYGQGTTDARSDVYALGATTYTLLTGVVPPAAMDIVAGDHPPPRPVGEINPRVSPALSGTMANAMQLHKAQRTPSAAAFRTALSRASAVPDPTVHGGHGGASASSIQAPPRRTAGKTRYPAWLPWVGGIMAVLLLVIGAYWIGSLINGGGGMANALSRTQTSQVLVSLLTATPQSPTGTSGEPSPLPTQTSPPPPSPTSIPLSSTDTPNFGTQMALVPAGNFMMGSDADVALAECQKHHSGCERSWFEDEEPVHEVYLDDFYIDVYEVTNARYAECVDAGNCAPPSSSESYSRDSYYGVSWHDAQAYCERRGARLPTEAEWEMAARGDLEGRLYPWGDESPVCRAGADNGAKFDDNTDCDDTDTERVGTYRPNGYGLYDMAGNVWEWVSDWYDKSYYEVSPSENPSGPASGEYRVLRGGSWDLNPYFLRAASRYYFDPSSTYGKIGFRCARSP